MSSVCVVCFLSCVIGNSISLLFFRPSFCLLGFLWFFRQNFQSIIIDFVTYCKMIIFLLIFMYLFFS